MIRSTEQKKINQRNSNKIIIRGIRSKKKCLQMKQFFWNQNYNIQIKKKYTNLSNIYLILIISISMFLFSFINNNFINYKIDKIIIINNNKYMWRVFLISLKMPIFLDKNLPKINKILNYFIDRN